MKGNCLGVMLVGGLCFCSCLAGLVRGEEKKPVASDAKSVDLPGATAPLKKETKAKRPGVGPKLSKPDREKREKSALAFVQAQHPELVNLLTWLRENKPGDYQRAIHEIAQASVRLERIREKQPQRYELELQVWKAGSRARLTAATAATTDDFSPEFFKESLAKDLRQQEEGRLKLLEMDQAALKEQLEKVNETLQSRRSSLEKKIEADTAKLLQSAEAQRKKTSVQKQAALQQKNETEKKAAEKQTPSGEKPVAKGKGSNPVEKPVEETPGEEKK